MSNFDEMDDIFNSIMGTGECEVEDVTTIKEDRFGLPDDYELNKVEGKFVVFNKNKPGFLTFANGKRVYVTFQSMSEFNDYEKALDNCNELGDKILYKEIVKAFFNAFDVDSGCRGLLLISRDGFITEATTNVHKRFSCSTNYISATVFKTLDQIANFTKHVEFYAVVPIEK